MKDQPRINTPCPACGSTTLFIGSAGRLTCSLIGCKDPTAMDRITRVMYDKDPNGMDAKTPGAKLDGGKTMAGVIADFGLALLAVAEVGTYGIKKYSRGGWENVPEGVQRYEDAMWRHLLREKSELLDPESGLLHEAHAAWCALARLELRLRKKT